MIKATAFALCLMAAPAMAQDYFGFQSPSGNIACVISTEGYARCDILQMTKMSFSKPPKSCEFDYGSSFGIGVGATKGEALCVSDTAAMPDLDVLEYGRSISEGGVSCTSAKTGMRCVNGDGHGFDIAKSGQKLF